MQNVENLYCCLSLFIYKAPFMQRHAEQSVLNITGNGSVLRHYHEEPSASEDDMDHNHGGRQHRGHPNQDRQGSTPRP